jgi:hypothetical protein
MTYKMPDGALANIDRMIELTTEKIALLHKLKKALMMAELIGIRPGDIKGTLWHGVTSYGAPQYARPWRVQEFVIRLDGEEVFRGKLTEVPLDLWPDDMRAEYERHQRRNKKETTQ